MVKMATTILSSQVIHKQAVAVFGQPCPKARVYCAQSHRNGPTAAQSLSPVAGAWFCVLVLMITSLNTG